MLFRSLSINNTTDATVKLFLINQLEKEKYLDFMIKEVNNIVRKEPDFQDALAYKNILADYYESLSKTKIGNHMPDFEYLTNEGNPMKFSTLKGNYVIIDFWASWCGPCRKSMPKLQNLSQQYNAKGLDILSSSIDTDDKEWKKAVEEEARPWHQIITPDKNKTMSDFRIKGVPTLFLVDKDGVIVEKFTGYNQRLEELLKNYLD